VTTLLLLLAAFLAPVAVLSAAAWVHDLIEGKAS
jgi:hypothetical protein